MSWFGNIRDRLRKSSNKIQANVTQAFTRKKLDAQALNEIEELLLTADLGPTITQDFIETLRQEKFTKDVSTHDVLITLAQQIEAALRPTAVPLVPNLDSPFVLLMVGVNGSGKTTTAGKLAAQWTAQGHKVRLVAADTFRAAAVEQLGIWAQRSHATFTQAEHATDPASVAYRGVEEALNHQEDIVIIDTAGRLQNKADLMAELSKINRVIKKLLLEAPHACVLVLDATTGQNALSQVSQFQEVAHVTGLIMTKLDGTAKGGILVNIAQKYKLPIHAIGIGESIDDLQPLEPETFARSLVGLEG